MGDEFSSPVVAMPRRDARGREDRRGHTTTSRIRVLDAIPFNSTLRFDMEAWHKSDWKRIEYAVATFIGQLVRCGLSCESRTINRLFRRRLYSRLLAGCFPILVAAGKR